MTHGVINYFILFYFVFFYTCVFIITHLLPAKSGHIFCYSFCIYKPARL